MPSELARDSYRVRVHHPHKRVEEIGTTDDKQQVIRWACDASGPVSIRTVRDGAIVIIRKRNVPRAVATGGAV